MKFDGHIEITTAAWPDVSRAQSMVMLNVTSGVCRPSDIARRLV